MKKRKVGKIGGFRYEFFIMVMIIICITYNLFYENFNYRYNAISITKSGAISILHDFDAVEEFREKGRPTIRFTHDTCDFVAVFTEDQQLHSNVMFTGIEYLWTDLYPLFNWWDTFYVTESGKIDLSPYGESMTLHYQWVDIDGARYLVVYNTNSTDAKLFTVFHVSCYVVISLSFVMLINILYWQNRGVANAYKKVNEEVKSIVSRD